MLITVSKKLTLSLIFLLTYFLIFANISFAASGQFKFKSNSNGIPEGQTAVVEVYINTDTPVNAAELHLSYPAGAYDITIDSNGSAFGIGAPDKATPGSLVISRGNIAPINGKVLFAKLNVKANQNGQVNQLQTVTGTQILTSNGNTNIYTSTEMDIPGVPSNTMPPVTATSAPKQEESVKNIIFRAIKEFFRKLFRL